MLPSGKLSAGGGMTCNHPNNATQRCNATEQLETCNATQQHNAAMPPTWRMESALTWEQWSCAPSRPSPGITPEPGSLRTRRRSAFSITDFTVSSHHCCHGNRAFLIVFQTLLNLRTVCGGGGGSPVPTVWLQHQCDKNYTFIFGLWGDEKRK